MCGGDGITGVVDEYGVGGVVVAGGERVDGGRAEEVEGRKSKEGGEWKRFIMRVVEQGKEATNGQWHGLGGARATGYLIKHRTTRATLHDNDTCYKEDGGPDSLVTCASLCPLLGALLLQRTAASVGDDGRWSVRVV